MDSKQDRYLDEHIEKILKGMSSSGDHFIGEWAERQKRLKIVAKRMIISGENISSDPETKLTLVRADTPEAMESRKEKTEEYHYEGHKFLWFSS